jgi:uncharacterized membrane protein YqjE
MTRATAREQMGLGTEQTERGLAAIVGRMTEGFSRLVTQHLALARAELVEDLRGLGKDTALMVAGVPFVLLGYAFLCAALAALLERWVGWAGALALVGSLNLVIGGVGIGVAASRLKQRSLMDGTTEELNRSVEVLAAQAEPVALVKESHHGR